jgi:hypothetical protein
MSIEASGGDRATQGPPRLTLITRRACHLCAEMAAVIDAVARTEPLALEVCEVDADPVLTARYGEQVPVLLINGRKAFKYRLDAAALCRRLQRERWRARLAAFFGPRST